MNGKSEKSPGPSFLNHSVSLFGKKIDLTVLVIGLAGLCVTVLLAVSHIGISGLPYCSEGGGCNLVQSSKWASFFGVPLAMWGVMGYASIIYVSSMGSRKKRQKYLAFIGTAGFGISIYLTIVSMMIIKAFCAYCLFSALLLAVAFLLGVQREIIGHRLLRRSSAVLVALVVVLLMHLEANDWSFLEQSSDPVLSELAEHLTARGFVFYGASWCPSCQVQKEFFGGAAYKLPYVECSPHGQKGPKSTVCVSKNITRYPTWDFRGRRLERVLSLENLASLSGFVLPEGY